MVIEEGYMEALNIVKWKNKQMVCEEEVSQRHQTPRVKTNRSPGKVELQEKWENKSVQEPKESGKTWRCIHEVAH